MLKRAWRDFAGVIASWWEGRDDDWLGTFADRVMAMLIVAVVAVSVLTVGLVLFALLGHPLVILCIIGSVAGVYALTFAVARIGKKVNEEKNAERDRYIAELLKDKESHEETSYEQ